jgi:hypothetical protein
MVVNLKITTVKVESSTFYQTKFNIFSVNFTLVIFHFVMVEFYIFEY